MIRRAERNVLTLWTCQPSGRSSALTPMSMQPAPCPIRTSPEAPAPGRATSWTTVPSMAAATDVQIPAVPASVRWHLPIEIIRTVRSIRSAG